MTGNLHIYDLDAEERTTFSVLNYNFFYSVIQVLYLHISRPFLSLLQFLPCFVPQPLIFYFQDFHTFKMWPASSPPAAVLLVWGMALSGKNVIIFLNVYICRSICVLGWTCMCVHICTVQRTILGVIFGNVIQFLWDRVFYWPGVHQFLARVGQEAQGPSGLCLPSTGIRSKCHQPLLSMGAGDWLRPYTLQTGPCPLLLKENKTK